MSILFIDTGYKDLGFALFGDDGKPWETKAIHFADDMGHNARLNGIYYFLYTMWIAKDDLGKIVYENYTVRDDSTGKSKRGQKTLFVNGFIHGMAHSMAMAVEEVHNRHWSEVYNRYRLHCELKGRTPLTPPENADEHVSDAFKMGVAYFVEKGIIK